MTTDPSVTPEQIAAFDAESLALGYTELLDRVWPPGTVLDTHSHPFDARAVVTQGEMWLSVEDATPATQATQATQHLGPGDRFELQRDTPHAERYGAAGATYRVARRS